LKKIILSQMSLKIFINNFLVLGNKKTLMLTTVLLQNEELTHILLAQKPNAIILFLDMQKAQMILLI